MLGIKKTAFWSLVVSFVVVYGLIFLGIAFLGAL